MQTYGPVVGILVLSSKKVNETNILSEKVSGI